MFIDRLQFLHLLDQAVQVVRHYDPLRHQDLWTQQHSVTSQGATAFSSTTTRTSKLTVTCCFKNATVNTEENYDKLQPEQKIWSLIHTLDHITLHRIPGQDMTYFKELCPPEWRDWEHPRNSLRQSNCACQARSELKTSWT